MTGAHRGLGWAIAQALSAAGARVVVNGRNSQGVAAAVERLQTAGGQARGAVFDVTDEAALHGAASDLRGADWLPDILVNNAGIHRRSPLLEMPTEDFEAVIRTNLTGPFLVARAFAPPMIERGGGKVINIASLMSELARPTTGNYAASKGGLKMLTRAMAAEWSAKKVQVNAIAPGYFVTELNRPLKDDPKFDSWVCGRTPSARWGAPEELGGTAVFLASAASDYVCGQVILVDGGMSCVV